MLKIDRRLLMYTLNSDRVAYHGRLPFACPGARYVVEGQLCELCRDGVLRPVAEQERRAA